MKAPIWVRASTGLNCWGFDVEGAEYQVYYQLSGFHQNHRMYVENRVRVVMIHMKGRR